MDFDCQKATCPSGKPPILFLHGWGGDKESFAFLKNWIVDRDLWSVSFAGHGKTGEPDRPMKVLDFAEEIEDFVCQHQLFGADLVAHSFGGRVALIALSKWPQMFGRALLVGCAGLKPKRSAFLRLKIFVFKIKKWLVRMKILSPRRLQNAGSEEYRVLSPVMRETFKLVVNQDLSAFARKIENEVLFVWGEKDTATPLWMAKKLNKLVENSSIVVMKNKTHFCFYEEPARFALILRCFFV